MTSTFIYDTFLCMPEELLTRAKFREQVFARDKHCAVKYCSASAQDAHHIIERRLWSDGGYYLDNGAALCSVHHLQAEQTTLSCDELREWCGITTVRLPEHLYRDQAYDKWGNPILPDGRRLRGELFDDESVQKVLAPVLHLFTDKVKYPRTYHLPWSPGATSDDRKMEDPDSCFAEREVVVTEKMDGENTTMYTDYIHARSLDYSPHPSRDRVKAMWANIAHDIPKGWRVCGENLFAKHSIAYTGLESYFQVFSIWNDKNVCLSWDETVEWAGLLGFPTVQVTHRGVYAPELINSLHEMQSVVSKLQQKLWSVFADEIEGYVIRLADSFHYKDFRKSAAKYVRTGHVVHQDGHWSNRVVVPNKLR